MLFKLAWRNIWRNRRRTFITISSILFAVFLAITMDSLQQGAWNHMINNVVNFYFGFAQVHQKGYWEEQSIDKAFAFADSLQELEREVPQIRSMLPRLESFALASTGKTTKGVLLVGIDPPVENSMTNLSNRLVKGQYLEASDDAVLLAEGIADYLDLGLGDTLILISQGYHGVNAAGKYPVKGIVHFGSPELNNQMVYMPLKTAQWFYGADGLVTSLALRIDGQEDIPPAVKALKTNLSLEEYEVMDWKEMVPELIRAKAIDAAGNYIVFFILYLVIAFGIFGTILMMIKEREYEFGILIAIGMHRLQLGITIWLETILLGFIGAVAGMITALPVVWYLKVKPLRFSGEFGGAMEKFGFEPIFPADILPRTFIVQTVIVLIITTLLALFPLFKLKRLKAVEAMRD